MENVMCIDDFIIYLQTFSADKRKLPLVIDCPNGLKVKPHVKMRWDNTIEIFSTPPDEMVITWK